MKNDFAFVCLLLLFIAVQSTHAQAAPLLNESNSTNAGNAITNNPLTVSVTPSSAVADLGQTITLTSAVSGNSTNLAYQWYNASGNATVEIPDANASAYNITALGNTGDLAYYVVVTENLSADNTTNSVAARSNNATLEVYPALNVTTSFYPPIINITSPHSFTANALYNTQVSGGTGDYVYTWDTSQLQPEDFIVNQSCYSGTPFCEITAANVTASVSGMLSVSISDTSDGNASFASPQYYFVTANPDPPLLSDYLGRNVSQAFANQLRIGIITPAIGQIVYGLGLGSEVVGVTDAVNETLPSFGIDMSKDVANIGLDYDYYLPDYFTELVNTTADYVPIDAGAYEGTLSQGLAAFQAGGIETVVLGGGFDKNISVVEDDVMLVANTTNTTQKGDSIVNGMNKILQYVNGKITGTPQPKVAMVIWYGDDSLYVDGSQSFIGSEISSVNAQDVFAGYYPSPSPQQFASGNPDYIIASIFGTPYDNISTTYQELAAIPGIKNTSAWKNGHVYVLGNLATNITDEPGPLAAYGTLIYAMILHPQQFGFGQTSVPNNITDQWVVENIRPDIYFSQFMPPSGTTTQTTTVPNQYGGVQVASSTTVISTVTTSTVSTTTQPQTTIINAIQTPARTTTIPAVCNLPNIPVGCTWVSTANVTAPCAGHIACTTTTTNPAQSGTQNNGGLLSELINMIIGFFERLFKL